MFISAILLAAGSNRRFKSCASKLLARINRHTVIYYSLTALNRHPKINEIAVVVNKQNRSAALKEIRASNIHKKVKVVLGGRRRQDSLGCALKALDKRARLVLIHDAARPFITKEIITGCLNEAIRSGAAIAGVPVKATIKRVKGKGLRVKETVDRKSLWEIQTPQVFEKELIVKAYRKFGKTDVTDDASLVEKTGRGVKIIPGSYLNIKITTPEDFILAKAITARIK